MLEDSATDSPTLTHQPGRMLPRDAIQCLKQDLSQISQHGLVSLSCTCEMIPQVMSCADGSGLLAGLHILCSATSWRSSVVTLAL